MLQHYRLHPRYVAEILKESIIKLKRLPNLNLASTAISKQITVCGDLHGKLDDLLVIFHKVIPFALIFSPNEISTALDGTPRFVEV